MARLRVWLWLSGTMALWSFPEPAHGLEWSLSTTQRGLYRSLPDDFQLSVLRYPAVTSTAATTRTAFQMHGLGHVEGRPSDAWGLRLGLDSGLLEIGPNGTFIDGADPLDRVKETFLLGETWVEYQAGSTGALAIRTGKLRAAVGESAVFDAYAFGGLVDLDLSLVDGALPLNFRLQGLFPGGTFTERTFKSPIIDAQLAYRLDTRTEVRLHTSLYLERGGSAPLLADALLQGQVARLIANRDLRQQRLAALRPMGPGENRLFNQFVNAAQAANDAFFQQTLAAANSGTLAYDVDTNGWVMWTGLSGEARYRPVELSGLFLLCLGRLDARFGPNATLEDGLRNLYDSLASVSPGLTRRLLGTSADALVERQEQTTELSLLSYFARLQARINLHRDLNFDTFLVAIGGDEALPAELEPQTPYRGFISLAPLMPYTSIFFGGTIAPNTSSPVVVSVAPDGRGLVAGGVGVDAYFGERLAARAVVATMTSLVPPAGGTAHFQGVEANLLVDGQITDILSAYLDLGVFVPGAYFGDLPTGYQALLALRAELR